MIRTLIAALALTTGPAVAETPQETAAAVDQWRAQNEAAILREARDLLRLPNHAADRAAILRNAEYLVTMIEARGGDARVLEAGESSPAVYGEILTPGATRTLLVYAHFDGQPVDRSLWATDPFEPVLMTDTHEAGGEVLDFDALPSPVPPEARLYARSSSDDKTPIVAVLAALDGLRAIGRAPSVNIKFFLEGEEEAGSPHLAEMLAAHADLLDADIWMFADGPMDPRGDPRVLLGVRGVMRFEVTTYGPISAQHSGHYGNVAPNPGARLAHLITSMRAPNGQILIDGLNTSADMSEVMTAHLRDGAFDDRAMLDQAAIPHPEWGPDALYGEAISYPALNVLALQMGDQTGASTNAVQPEATGVFGLRLTPGVDLDDARAAIRRHIEGQGYQLVEAAPDRETRLSHPRLARLTFSEWGYEAAQADIADPRVARLIEVVDAADPRPLRVVPIIGGSLPISPIQSVLGAEFVIVPMVNADNNQHAPNENLRMAEFWYGISTYAAVLAHYGEED